MNSQSENSTQQNSAVDMLRKKNTRTLSELEQIPYQPQVYAIPIEQRKRESKLLADAVEFQPKLYQMIERLATAEELSDHCIRIQNIEAEYMEKTVREVVTENRKTAAQMQSLIEQAGKNQERFISNCSETLSKSTNGAGQHDRETAPKNFENYDSRGGIGGGAVAAGLRGILEAGSIIDGTAEDPEERRKRIEAQENASNLGAVIGLAVGILTAAADSEEDMTAEENDEPTIKM